MFLQKVPNKQKNFFFKLVFSRRLDEGGGAARGGGSMTEIAGSGSASGSASGSISQRHRSADPESDIFLWDRRKIVIAFSSLGALI
jgi:hypothetical protein